MGCKCTPGGVHFSPGRQEFTSPLKARVHFSPGRQGFTSPLLLWDAEAYSWRSSLLSRRQEFTSPLKARVHLSSPPLGCKSVLLEEFTPL